MADDAAADTPAPATGASSAPGGPALLAAVEAGRSRTFAFALDWPGWCRSAKDEAGALDALTAYRPRYDAVVHRAGLALPQAPFAVVERLVGGTTTDFGAPEKVAAADARPLDGARAGEHAALLSAAWELFDEVVGSSSAQLRKGPRGGGRDRDQVRDHVVNAERAYARRLGVRVRPFEPADLHAREALRSELLARVRDGSAGAETQWPVRYAVRRLTWHVLDHAWEIEDKRS